MAERKQEFRGKSWRREREERGRRQLAQRSQSNASTNSDNGQNGMEEAYTQEMKDSQRKPNANTVEDGKDCNDAQDGSKEDSVASSSNLCDQPVDDPQHDENQRKEQEAQMIEEEEKKQLEQFIAETLEKIRSKAELRLTNSTASANRPEEHFFGKLDSSLKKNTAFIKRLKNMTDAQKQSLVKDMKALNLTKYISEAAAAIVDAKIKMSDVTMAIQMCSLLHQRYTDFSPQLLEHWQKVLPMKKDEKISNPSKIRVDLRFYAELVCCGVFTLKEGLPLLGNLLTVLTSTDKEEHNNLNILLSFCRHCGEDYAGLVPRKFRILVQKYEKEVPKSDFLPADRQKGLRTLLKEYFKSLCKHLVKDFKNLQNNERQNHRILQTKGELSSERKEKYEASQIAFQKLVSNGQQFADIVDEDMPKLPKEENFNSDESAALDIHNRFKDGDNETITSLWEDDDTRSFYENMPDLKAFIPGILFKDSSQSLPQSAPEPAEEKLDDELNKLEEAELIEAEIKEEVEVKEVGKENEKDLTETLLQEIEETEEEAVVTNTANKLLLDSFLTSLLHCVNREIIDQAAVDFCMNLNTKPNRKKLVRSLFLVPRTRLDLLPFYSRFVATLCPCMPDVATDLVTMLKQDFKFHIKKKDQINIESKVKTVRFIGELVKFKIFPKTEALCCLKRLLSDFVHHHIDMACNLLETCGRFLFRSPDSYQRTKVYLEQMMVKKSLMSLDSRYTTMIENAFYYCNPPEAPPTVAIERPPMHEYIRKLLYKDLAKPTTEKGSDHYSSSSTKILRQMRKLNWDDPENSAYITKCLTAIWNVKFYNIRCLANLLAGLVSYQENVGPQVIDGVLEDIRLGMEINHPKYNQRRVSMVRYLGELYNYRMVESVVIFKVLYSFITFGVYYDGTYSDLDSPDHLFRLRLVCTLLDTCGQYFDTGSSKKKLDCFLVFFQRYYWHKKSHEMYTDEFPFPVTIKFMVTDTISALRPKLKLFENLEQALQGVQELLNEFKPKLVEVFPTVFADENSNSVEKQQQAKEAGLGPIQEVDEEPEEEGQSESSYYQDGETDTDGFSGSQSQPLEEETESARRTELSLSDNENEQSYDGSQDAPVITSAPKHINCAEDEDFMTAFDKMLSESILHRNQEFVKPQADIVIPMNIKGNANKKTVIFPDIKVEERPTINFVLMTRRGNKQQFKNLAVPVSSELAQNLKDREEAERVEKQHVKLLTLNINERQEEEDYQEMLAAQQRPTVMNLNRDRRQKYHHPKGAPDADLIFGNKGSEKPVCMLSGSIEKRFNVASSTLFPPNSTTFDEEFRGKC